MNIESSERGREIMRGKGEGRRREKVEIMKILGIYCGSEFLNKTNQNLLYKKCLFVFWWGRKNFQGNYGAEGLPTNVAFKLWSSFTLLAAHLFVMLWSRK